MVECIGRFSKLFSLSYNLCFVPQGHVELKVGLS